MDGMSLLGRGIGRLPGGDVCTGQRSGKHVHQAEAKRLQKEELLRWLLRGYGWLWGCREGFLKGRGQGSRSIE